MKKLAYGKMRLQMDIDKFPNVVIKESSKNNVKVTKEGNYWRLIGDVQFMQLHTKSKVEIKELYSSYDLAYGDVLITGLGFGLLALWLSNKPQVKSVTVVEQSQDVIDLFLENNSLPDKVKIIVADANTYTTDVHYDCLLLDHYKDGAEEKVDYKTLQKIAVNIPHDLLWFWSIELLYVKSIHEISNEELYRYPIDLSLINFSEKWQEWLDFLSVPTIPTPAPDKLQEYIQFYFNRK
jgi:hypothetical protein